MLMDTNGNTKELIKDLCSRLPYGVKVSKVVENWTSDPHPIRSVNLNNIIVEDGEFEDGTPDIDIWDYEEIKPYLFPLSSMTDEQWRELFETAGYEVREEDCGRHTEMYYYDMVGHNNTLYPSCDAIDWLNDHHYDYRGLIEKGLAIDATGLNIY